MGNRRLSRQEPEAEPEPEYRDIGYARVSTEDQNLNLQLDALRKIGVREENLHWEKLSAVAKNRPKLELAIKDCHEGDRFNVWKLDRLARNMDDLLFRLRQIKENGAEFRSVTEAIDTTTPAGKFLLYVMGAVATFERDLTAARTKAGMKAAADRGLRLGRERKMDDAMIERAHKLLRKGGTVAAVARKLKVSKPSIYNYFKVKRTKLGRAIVTKRNKKAK